MPSKQALTTLLPFVTESELKPQLLTIIHFYPVWQKVELYTFNAEYQEHQHNVAPKARDNFRNNGVKFL